MNYSRAFSICGIGDALVFYCQSDLLFIFSLDVSIDQLWAMKSMVDISQIFAQTPCHKE